MLRNRPFRLFVFHILLAVPFVILSAYVSTIKPTGVKIYVNVLKWLQWQILPESL